MRAIHVAFTATAWLFLGCVVVQVFLAGMGVFGGAGYDAHRTFGYVFGWLTLALLVLAIVGRMGRATIIGASALLVLFALQSLFVALRADVPWAAALHPVNALAIFFVAWHLVRAEPPQGAEA